MVQARYAPPQQRQTGWSRRFGKSQQIHHASIPSGLAGRLALLYVNTELWRTVDGHIGSGRSVEDVCRWLGLGPSRGKRSGVYAVREQIKLVLDMHTTTRDADGREIEIKAVVGSKTKQHLARNFDPLMLPADDIWLTGRPPVPEGGKKSWFDRSVPVSMEVIRELGRDLLAIDLYIALTYRSSTNTGRPFLLTFDSLRGQLGANFADGSKRLFKQRLLAALAKIRPLYPELAVEVTQWGLRVLSVSRPHIPLRASRSLGGQDGVWSVATARHSGRAPPDG